MPALIVRPCKPSDGPVERPRFEVVVHGYANSGTCKLIVWHKKGASTSNKFDESRVVAELSVKLEKESEPRGLAKVYKITNASVTKNEWKGPELELVFPPGTSPVRVKLPEKWPGDADGRGERHASDEGDSWYLVLALYAEGDTEVAVSSPSFSVATVRRALPARKGWDESRATYSWHAGHDVTFYNDASEDRTGGAGAFRDIRDAIEHAHRLVFVVDWSFHPYARLTQNPYPLVADTVGAVLVQRAHTMNLVKKDFLVAVHTWDHTSPAREIPNEAGDAGLDSIAKLMGLGNTRPANVLWRASNRTGEGGTSGFGFSHHQKFVVVDTEARDGSGRRELMAFFGGLDLTKGRFDWPAHVIDPDLTVSPESEYFLGQITGRAMDLSTTFRSASKYKTDAETYDDWYNAEFGGDRTCPRQPWHDIHAKITGPAAWDIVREFVGRWNLDAATPGCRGDGTSTAGRLNDLLYALLDRTKFVQQWEKPIGDWSAQVLRSQCKIHWSPSPPLKAKRVDGTLRGQHEAKEEFVWPLKKIARGIMRSDYEMESSIQDAYLRVLKQAERFVYVETQYLLGSGSKWGRDTLANKVPETVVDRAVELAGKQKPFHAYFVLPMFPEGDPGSMALRTVKEYQWKTIQWMVSSLNSRLPGGGQEKWKPYLSFYFLAQWHDLPNGPVTTSLDRMSRVKANKRYMIYVHSKLAIVDDRYVILGSANLNERSLHGGRDSEICLGLWPTVRQGVGKVEGEVKRLRRRLWREHLGQDLDAGLFDAPESSGCVDEVRRQAHKNLLDLYAGKRSGGDMTAWPHLCRWPLELNTAGKLEFVEKADRATYLTIVDGPSKRNMMRNVVPDEDWNWTTSTWMPSDIPE